MPAHQEYSEKVLKILNARAAEARAVSSKEADNATARGRAANLEMHRIMIAGAAGGIAVLASMIGNLDRSAQLVGGVAILFLIHSLRCSLLTFQAMWIERTEEAAQWAEWGARAVDAAYETIGGQPAPLVLPPVPKIPVEKYTRWSSAAVGSLSGGGVTGAMTVFLSLGIETPLWLLNLPHRVGHWLGWV